MSSTFWIVIAAIVAVLVIAAVIFAASRAARRRRQRQAEEIREQAKVESSRVERRQTLADETAARARAAQAEAEAKAAEAARLQERASTHQRDVAASREQLEDHWKRADSLDPNVTESGEATAERRDAPLGETPHDPVAGAGHARPQRPASS